MGELASKSAYQKGKKKKEKKRKKRKDGQIGNFLQNETFLRPREYLKAIDMTGREKHKEDCHWQWGSTKNLVSQLEYE